MQSSRSTHTPGETIVNTQDNNSYTASTLSGYLTQCVHPVEKRVLERMWGMKFGWGDDMRRWEAVEDGWLMGGTGRFSGKVFANDQHQQAQPVIESEDEEQEGKKKRFSKRRSRRIARRTDQRLSTTAEASTVTVPDLTDTDDEEPGWDDSQTASASFVRW